MVPMPIPPPVRVPAPARDTTEGDRIPEAWPTLMSKRQLAAYTGISSATLARVCPVPPLRMGARVLRWRRSDVDAWIGGLPFRIVPSREEEENAATPQHMAGDSRRSAALDRVRDRSARLENSSCRRRRA